MTEQEKTDFTPVAIECDEPQGMIQIKVPDDQKYGTSPRFDARRTYNDKETDDVRFTKNGLNLPADKVLPWIDVMLEAYNQAFGTEHVRWETNPFPGGEEFDES